MMSPLRSSRAAGFLMPALFAVSIIFCLVRVGQTATHEYFFKKPFFKWDQQQDGVDRRGAVVWHADDLDAEWKVLYHLGDDPRWRAAAARVTSLVHSDFLTRHRVYNAELSGLPAGRPIEYKVFRNNIKVYSGEIVAGQTRIHEERP